tara:strand:- start:3896 stop:4288 length:393 start_codon:yes stop_codon:yes gene_type:complete
MIIILSSLLLAEPKFTELEAGECAPWKGRLLNDEALTELIVQDQTNKMSCDFRVEFEVNKVLIEEKYKYNLLETKYKAETTKLNEILKIRDQQIEKMKPRDNSLFIAGGFILGATTAIAIMYAVRPGMTQ